MLLNFQNFKYICTMTITIDDKTIAFFGAAIIVIFIGMGLSLIFNKLSGMLEKDVKREPINFYSNIEQVGDYNLLITSGIEDSSDRRIPTSHYYDAHIWIKDDVIAKNQSPLHKEFPIGTYIDSKTLTDLKNKLESINN